jgi:acetyl esterase/lipase
MANSSVEQHNNIAYAPTISRDKDRELDLYVPAGEKGGKKPPLIVFVHGGAWGGYVLIEY